VHEVRKVLEVQEVLGCTRCTRCSEYLASRRWQSRFGLRDWRQRALGRLLSAARDLDPTQLRFGNSTNLHSGPG